MTGWDKAAAWQRQQEWRRRSLPRRLLGFAGGLAWLLVWTFPLVNAADAVLHGQVHPTWPAAVGLVVFLLSYLLGMFTGFAQVGPPVFRYGTLAVAVLVGVPLAFGYTGQPGSFEQVLLFVAVVAAAVLSTRPAVAAIAVVALLVLLLARLRHLSGDSLSQLMFSVVMSGALVLVVRRMSLLIEELRGTRQAVADGAVAEERLRFARDLHDLLGHTLSVIVVKAEVVRRLAERDPAAAAGQAGEIEQIGRQALGEIREAVTGYRQGGLRQELDRARASLRDAGIEPTVQTTGEPLPPATDALLTWAVREGVTNVIRHSGARTCRIEVGRQGDGAYTLIVDDGAGPAGHGGCAGNGLRGLTERMTAAGGTVSAGRAGDRGYRLAVRLPLVVLP